MNKKKATITVRLELREYQRVHLAAHWDAIKRHDQKGSMNRFCVAAILGAVQVTEKTMPEGLKPGYLNPE